MPLRAAVFTCMGHKINVMYVDACAPGTLCGVTTHHSNHLPYPSTVYYSILATQLSHLEHP